ncbi:MAG: hypothetical protein HZB19_02745 [Chloroflexi bacterium]|nr:hypothetical protein [Chloroflexota bacterium]
MNVQTNLIEMRDAELQERVAVVIEDNARPAEQIINEQNTERDADENSSAPRFIP